MKSVLVVCEGNICRSPMAWGLLTRALPGLPVRSAGLRALSGMPPHETAVTLMCARGIDIAAHRAMQINSDLCLGSDLVLVMDEQQRKQLETAYPSARGRIFRLGKFGDFDVPDPYGAGQDAFRHSLRLIEKGVREWHRRIRNI